MIILFIIKQNVKYVFECKYDKVYYLKNNQSNQTQVQ